jgi:hypothetical protein
MPSRAELRRTAEWLLRAALLVALGVALWRSLRSTEASTGARSTTSQTLARELARSIATPGDVGLDLALDAAPTHEERDALVALRRTGTAVRWHGDPPSLGLEVARTREPDARSRIMLVGGGDAPLALSDSAGVLDTVRTGAGLTLDLSTIVGAARAQRAQWIARAPAPAIAPRRAVLVLGRAGWETKFVMSALSEAGWTVRARIPFAPGVSVRDDGLLPLDTTRYDAVVALDSSASDLAAGIAKFVAQGGGLVAEAGAISLDELRPVAPASAGIREPGRILLAEDTITPRDLPIRPLSDLRTDAIALERAPAGVTTAARRAGMGRVLLTGYDESWRWRMLGGTSGLPAHRAWWSRAVGSVSPERGEDASHDADAAPRAAIVDALGPAASAASQASRVPLDPLPLAILIVAIAALLAETASRRFRGER